MVEGHSLSIDESAMTGESDPVRTLQSLLMFAFPVWSLQFGSENQNFFFACHDNIGASLHCILSVLNIAAGYEGP